MFRRFAIAIATLVVLVVAAALITPYFVGRQAEASFKAEISKFNANTNGGITLQVAEYHRGFYSSDATVSLEGETSQENRLFGILFGTGTQAQFHIRINHGPIPFTDFPAHAQWVPVLYTAEFRGENLPALSLIGALKPEIRTVEYFDGATETTARIPPGRFSLGLLGMTWRGGRIAYHVNGAYDHVIYEGAVKSFDFQAADPSTGQTFSGTVKGFSFSGNREKVAHDFWVGDSSGYFGGANFKTGGTETVDLAPGHGTSTISESGSGRWLNGSAHGELGGGTIRGWRFTSFSTDGSVEKIDAAGLRRALDEVRSETAETAKGGRRPSARQFAGIFGTALGRAVTSDTRARLELMLAAPSGSLAVAATAGFAAPAPATVAAGSAIDRASGRLVIRFARGLVEDFAAKVLGGQSVQELDLGLQQMAGEGYLAVGANGVYSAVVVYHDGLLTVNGKPVESSDTAAPQPGTSGP